MDINLRLCTALVVLSHAAEYREAILQHAAMTAALEFEKDSEGEMIIARTEGSDAMAISRFDNGLTVSEESENLAWFRQIRDTLSSSIREHFDDPTVKEWLENNGGYQKVQEYLAGEPLGPGSKYAAVRQQLIEDLGYEPSSMGEPTQEELYESATQYGDYAVEAHRVCQNREHYGERDIEDESDSVPSWALRDEDFNLNLLPHWWDNIHMGRFRDGREVKDGTGRQAIQTENAMFPWMIDIRFVKWMDREDGEPATIKDLIGSRRSVHISKLAAWNVMVDHPMVKELINRFYNDPDRLVWKKIPGSNNRERWACGMPTNKGVLWTPLTYESSQYLDWRKKGETYEPKPRRALYGGDWIITYEKRGDNIHYAVMKQDNATGLMGVWKDKSVHWTEWADLKRSVIKKGYKDAYLGYPWKSYVAPKKVDEDRDWYDL